MEILMVQTKSSIPVVSEYEQKFVDSLNSGSVAAAEEAFHADCIIHINGNPQRDLSLNEFKQMVTGLLGAFPDLHFTINDHFTAGDKVTTRWTANGTNTGSFGEMPATGKVVEIEGLIIDRVVDGKVAHRWEL